MNKEFMFFTYLLESYAQYKNMETADVLQLLEEKDLTDFVYKMYEIYHSEAIENAYRDIDSLLENGKTAW